MAPSNRHLPQEQYYYITNLEVCQVNSLLPWEKSNDLVPYERIISSLSIGSLP